MDSNGDDRDDERHNRDDHRRSYGDRSNGDRYNGDRYNDDRSNGDSSNDNGDRYNNNGDRYNNQRRPGKVTSSHLSAVATSCHICVDESNIVLMVFSRQMTTDNMLFYDPIKWK